MNVSILGDSGLGLTGSYHLGGSLTLPPSVLLQDWYDADAVEENGCEVRGPRKQRPRVLTSSQRILPATLIILATPPPAVLPAILAGSTVHSTLT